MRVGVDVIGVEAVKLVIGSTYAKEVLKTKKVISEAATVCRNGTRKRCPVGTPQSTGKKNYKGGTLKASYSAASSIDGLESIVFTDVPYGKYVELGTYKMAAQPHLYPGFLDGAIWLMAAFGTTPL